MSRIIKIITLFITLLFSNLLSQSNELELKIIKKLPPLPIEKYPPNERAQPKRINLILEADTTFDGKPCDFLIIINRNIRYFDRDGNLVSEKYYNSQIVKFSNNANYVLLTDFKEQRGFSPPPIKNVRLEKINGTVLCERNYYHGYNLGRIVCDQPILASNGLFVIPPTGYQYLGYDDKILPQQDQNIFIYNTKGDSSKIPMIKKYRIYNTLGASAISPEGDFFFVNYKYTNSWDSAGSVIALYDLINQKELWYYKFASHYSNCSQVSSHAKYIICPCGKIDKNSKTKYSLLFMQKDGTIIKNINYPDYTVVRAMSPDGLFSAVETREQNGHSFSLYFNPTGEIVWKHLNEGKHSCFAISISNNGDYLSTFCICEGSETLLIFNKQGNIILRKKTDHCYYNRISPDGKFLWLSNREGEILYYKVNKL